MKESLAKSRRLNSLIIRTARPLAPALYWGVGKPWQRMLVLGLAFLLAITGTFVFAYRAGRHARQIRLTDEPIRPWMSVPFIAHTRHVPATLLFQAIGLRPEPHDRRSVRHIAHDLNRPVPELMAQLQRVLDAAPHTVGSQPQ